MLKIPVILLICFLGSCSISVKAQDDSSFAEIYRKVRSITDSFKTYSLYLIPFQSSDKVKLGALYQRKLSEVFHFLKKDKELNFENPDFIIGFLVDNQSLHNPNGAGSYAAGLNGSISFSKATHRFHFTVLIHTKNNQQLQFPLGGMLYVTKQITETPTYGFNNQIKDSITRNRRPENQGYLLRDNVGSSSSSISDSRLIPNVDDYKSQLLKVFQLFRNKYVDRVYN